MNKTTKRVTALAAMILVAAMAFAEPELYFSTGHSQQVNAICYSPDGKYIASGSDDNTVKLWNSETAQELRTFKGHSARVHSVDWSPNGAYVASAATKDSVQIWEAKTGKVLYKIELDFPTSVKWSPNGKYFVATFGGEQGSIRVYSTQNGREIYCFNFSYATSANWSPDSKYIISGGTNAIYKWDISTGRMVNGLPVKNTTDVCFSPDGKCIAGLDYNAKRLKIWDAVTGNEVVTFDENFGGVLAWNWNYNGTYIATAYYSNVIIWNAQTGKKIRDFRNASPDYKFYNHCLSWQQNVNVIAVAESNRITVCDALTAKEKIQLGQKHINWIKNISISPDGKQFVAGNWLGEKYSSNIWETATGERKVGLKRCSLSSHYDDVEAVAWSPNGKYIAEAINTTSNILRLSDAVTGEEIQRFDVGERTKTKAITFNPSGKLLAYYCNNYQTKNYVIKICDIPSGKTVQTLTATSEFVSLKWSPNGKYLIGTINIGEVPNNTSLLRIWDAVDWKQVKSFENYGSMIDFSNDGKYFISSTGRDFTVFETGTWRITNQFELKEYAAVIRWSPDTKHFVVGDLNGFIKVYDINGNETFKIKGHNASVKALAYTPDGHLISGGNDGAISVWNTTTWECIYSIVVNEDGEYLTYTPEGYFTGTEWATKNLVYLVEGMNVIELNQMYETFYRPDLVAAKLRGEDISGASIELTGSAAPVLEQLVSSGEAPMVQFSGVPASSARRDVTVSFTVQDMGGGIGDVYLSVNGKVIQIAAGSRGFVLEGVPAASVPAAQTNGGGGKPVQFSHLLSLQNGENTLEAYATNAAGKIESRRAVAKISWQGATQKPNLYVLSVGVNEYRDRSLKLNYAVPDATSIADIFGRAKGNLYQSVNVETVLNENATAQGIAAAFNSVAAKVGADDVFIFYLSGHGTSYTDGDYYFIPQDFRYRNSESIPQSAISKHFITEQLSKIRAQKSIILLDTCNSGAFISTAQRGMAEKTAIDRLSRATGQATIAASSDTQSAMEGYEGHGIFTYVVLEALSGNADANNDGYVSLSELSAYIEDKVPEYSDSKWGYEQYPQVDLRKQTNFPLVGK